MLKNMTSHQEAFSRKNISYHGYYSTVPLCLPGMYSKDLQLPFYRLVLFVIVLVELSLVAASRIGIRIGHFLSRKDVRTLQTDDRKTTLTGKILFLIMINTVGWIPSLIVIILSFYDVYFSEMFLECLAIIFAPSVAVFGQDVEVPESSYVKAHISH